MGDREHTRPRFYRDTIGSVLACLGKTVGGLRQTKEGSFVMEHLFRYLLFSLNRRTICSEGDSKCALLSLTRRIDEQTGQLAGPSCDTFGGMCTQRGRGSPQPLRRATVTQRTKKGRTGWVVTVSRCAYIRYRRGGYTPTDGCPSRAHGNLWHYAGFCVRTLP